jgi:hypothetical protein
VIAAIGAAVACRALPAASFVQNPSFEVNFNETWPHYGGIDGWTVEGGSGVNQADGPFHNAGTAVPDRDRIAFKQGGGKLSQLITGLTAGKRYWIQFYYDARACCGGTIRSIIVKWNNATVDNIPNVVPNADPIRAYYLHSAPFTPDSDTGNLTLDTVIEGDATANVDAVTIVQRDEGNIVVANPSFEASGPPTVDIAFPPAFHSGELFTEPLDLPPAALAGWVATGQYGISLDGGAYADNGAIPDQDLVGFLAGPDSSFSQVVSGLIPGTKYDLSFAYNARNGETPHLQVKVDDAVLHEEDVTPVGGANPYHTRTLSFTPAAATAVITFSQLEGGDATLLLDDVRVVGQVAEELPPLSFSPTSEEISPGQRVAIQLTVPGKLLAGQTVDLQLGMDRPERAQLVDADAGGVLVLHFDQGGNTTRSFEIEGVGTGTAYLNLLNLADYPGLKLAFDVSVEVVTSFVRNASFEASPVPGDAGNGPIKGWTGGSGLNAQGGPFTDNSSIPDRNQVAFLQGPVTLSQQIFALTPGKNYWLQFRYNARLFGGTAINLSVKFDGKELGKFEDIIAADFYPYYFANLEFTPGGSTGLLEFITSVAAGVDATLLLDAVSIVQRDPGEVVIENPSFEASGNPVGVGYLGPISGWTGGSGVNIGTQPFGPFTDNGAAPDQDRVVFLQGNGSLRQHLTGLEEGQQYTLIYALDRRNCCGASTVTHSVSFADLPLVLEQEVLSVGPHGEANPYVTRFLPFEAAVPEGDLVFTTSVQGDATLLLDDVRIQPGTILPPPEICDNLVDDDGDGAVDCADDECAQAAPCSVVLFRRGDVDANGVVEITDPINNLTYQFLGGFQPTCLDACDDDDSGAIDISDPIFSLTGLFLGGLPQPDPGPVFCGLDFTEDSLEPPVNGDLGCASYAPANPCQ